MIPVRVTVKRKQDNPLLSKQQNWSLADWTVWTMALTQQTFGNTPRALYLCMQIKVFCLEKLEEKI
jgi:hypothetical protein